ncbi:MAG TPA: phosphatase PAP2 family protein [Prolixibacteraceae bacterium]
MIQTISEWDKSAFLYLNGYHSDLMDYVMTLFTLTPTWILFYGVTLYIIIRKYGRKSIPVIISIVLVILLSDQISGLLKHSVMRLRPSNDPDVSPYAHVFFTKGGLYGFVSAHAANVFSFATFTAFLFRSRGYTIFIFPWACLIAYTRIYLGVHYPGDILGGMLLGAFIGWAVYRLLILVESRFFPIHPYQRSKLNLNELETVVVPATLILFFTFTLVVLMMQNDLL